MPTLTKTCTVLKVDSRVREIDLHSYEQITYCCFPTPVEEEHYQLLAYLSSQLPSGSKVADLGTFQGASALALAYNPEVNVYTYDIDNSKHIKFEMFKNIHFKQANCLECVEEFLDAVLIMLDLDPHDGIQEQLLLQELSKHQYKGIMICDDICLNSQMDEFWKNIKLRKFDITKYGHYSGTGVVVFDKNAIDLKIKG
jgi:predicted O-methyltransferase YrrM